jgi:hypothetical protein
MTKNRTVSGWQKDGNWFKWGVSSAVGIFASKTVENRHDYGFWASTAVLLAAMGLSLLLLGAIHAAHHKLTSQSDSQIDHERDGP